MSIRSMPTTRREGRDKVFGDNQGHGKDAWFQKGDEVEFEMFYGKRNIPRWSFDENLGGSEVDDKGIVFDKQVGSLTVFGMETGYWLWPLPGHRLYADDQWDRPGYLKHAEPTRNRGCPCVTCAGEEANDRALIDDASVRLLELVEARPHSEPIKPQKRRTRMGLTPYEWAILGSAVFVAAVGSALMGGIVYALVELVGHIM